LFNSSSILNITLLEEFFLFTEAKPNHALSWFHGASHLSQVPWREVEGHHSSGDEPSVTLAQQNELSSRASTTMNNAFNTLQRSEYLRKMGWIKRNPRRIQGVGEQRQPVGQQQSDGMDYEDRQTSLFQGVEAIRPRSRRRRLYEPVCI